jgi:hypothetical protein
VGDPLNTQMLEAFADELSKMADWRSSALKGLGAAGRRIITAPGNLGRSIIKAPGSIGKSLSKVPGEFQELGNRFLDPVKGLSRGWAENSPTQSLKVLKGPELHKLRKELKGAGSHFQGEKAYREESLGNILKGTTKGVQEGGRLRATAEELSRRGWTGQGNASKYLPVGSKGLTVGLPLALSAPDVLHAPSTTPTGEGGAFETGLGEALGTGGFITAGRLGMLPGMAAYLGARHVGGGLGRVIDRLRGGASLGTAVRAPSPTEATEQLENVQRYYG